MGAHSVEIKLAIYVFNILMSVEMQFLYKKKLIPTSRYPSSLSIESSYLWLLGSSKIKKSGGIIISPSLPKKQFNKNIQTLQKFIANDWVKVLFYFKKIKKRIGNIMQLRIFKNHIFKTACIQKTITEFDPRSASK